VSGPFRTAIAYQAGRLDLDFYERFYTLEALSDTQRAGVGLPHDHPSSSL